MADYNITITSGAQGAPGQGVPAGGTTGQFLKKTDNTDFNTEWSDSSAVVNSLNDVNDVVLTAPSSGEVLKFDGTNWVNGTDATGGTAVWGGITGTLANQTDLVTALSLKSDTSHNHTGVYAPISHTHTLSNISDLATLTITESQISDFGSYAASVHTHVMADITDSTWISDYTVTQLDVTTHEAALTITESQISDLQSYALASHNHTLASLSDVNVGSPGALQDGYSVTWDNDTSSFILLDISAGGSATWGGITGTLSNQTDLQTALDGKSDTSHNHTIDSLSNVNTATKQPDDILAWNNGTGNWLPYSMNELLAAGSIKSLSDVWSSMVPEDGQILTYSSVNGWVAAANSAAAATHTHVLADITDAGTIASQNADSVAITGGTAILSSVQLSGGTGSQGTITWNTDEETLDLVQDGATLQLGQELQYHVRNNSGLTITNGTPVMATGTIGASGRITIAPMDGTVQANARYFIGITTEDIPNDTDGKVTHFGKVRGLVTDGSNYGETWADGDILYVSTTTAGYLTKVEPTSGMNLPIAMVIHSAASNGTMAVRVNTTDVNAFADAVHTHTLSDITDLASLTITESQISDFGSYIPTTEKGAANGVATLDAGSKIPLSQLPALALTDVNVVADETAQLALTAQEGDLAIRTDLNKSYAHNGGVAGTMADWSELLTPTDAVLSVDGRTGAVTLSDLYAALVHSHDDLYYTEAEVDTFLSGKSDTGHTHTESDITDLDKYTQAQVDAALALKADADDITIENGFVNRTDSTISFVDGTRTFTIAPAVTDFTFWAGGVKYTKSGAENVVITDQEGIHAIYYNGSTLTSEYSPTPETFDNLIIPTYAFVAAIYWDAVNNEAIIIEDERHGRVMDSRTHRYLHNTVGTAYESGLALTDMVVDGGGSLATEAQLGYIAGAIWDEDIYFEIDALAGGNNIPLFRRDGNNGDWRRTYTPYTVLTTGTGRAAYNEWTGVTWQQTEVVNNDFVLTHYFATGDINDSVIAIQGQGSYGSIALAQAAAETEITSLSFGQMEALTTEFKAIATVINQTSNTYTNAVKTTVVSTSGGDDYVDWRSAAALSSGGSAAVNHEDLAGLLGGAADDHQHLTTAQVALVDASVQPGDNISTLTNDSGFITGYTVTEGDVTAHQAALSITESQISDLQTYQVKSTATLQTTDATTTVLASIAIPSGEEKIISVRVHGHQDATNDHIWKTLTFGVKNIAGTATQVGGVDAAVGYDAGASTWAIVAGVSSGNATITVTGEASHSIDWRATIVVD